MPRTPTAGPATTWVCPTCKVKVTVYVPVEPGDIVCNGSHRHASTQMKKEN